VRVLDEIDRSGTDEVIAFATNSLRRARRGSGVGGLLRRCAPSTLAAGGKRGEERDDGDEERAPYC
jgi:hypothetical protein